MAILSIRQVTSGDRPTFQVVRGSDGKAAPSTAAITPPAEVHAEGRPSTNLLEDLRWYLEHFLDNPKDANVDVARRVLEALSRWGRESFKTLFDAVEARRYFDTATAGGHQNLTLRIVSNDPAVLGWPWEALEDPEAPGAALSHLCALERRLEEVRDPQASPDALPKDRVNILLVTARPFENDVAYRSISTPLVDLVHKETSPLPAAVTVLRPPTFETLQDHLREHPNTYHVLHFDGHGSYGATSDDVAAMIAATASQGQFDFHVHSRGRLVFESAESASKPNLVEAGTLAALLREHGIPCIVLNACQSAMVDAGAKDPFASVAGSLVQAGVRDVVAMCYSIYVTAAREFLPQFYGELFRSRSVAQAVRAGRKRLLEHPKRNCNRGRYPLQDWLVPVHYTNNPDVTPPFGFAGTAASEPFASQLPEEARLSVAREPHGIIGRDRTILALERGLREAPAAQLISGMGGQGKTTLARGFLDWLEKTGGIKGDRVFWTTFDDSIRRAESVLNVYGMAIFGTNFAAAPLKERMAELAQILRRERFLLVWDNFEVVKGIPGTALDPTITDDVDLLRQFVQELRGGQTKVLITSRSPEGWLGDAPFVRPLPLGGLTGEELWEYVNALLRDFDKQQDPEKPDPDLARLVEALRGHPLSLRVMLPKLQNSGGASAVLEAWQKSFAGLATEVTNDAERRLFATAQFAADGLEPELQPLLVPLALHERFVDGDFLEQMATTVEGAPNRPAIDRFLRALERGGLLCELGNSIFEMHPALWGFLQCRRPDAESLGQEEAWTRAYVSFFGRYADQLAPEPLHEQRFGFHIHGASFRRALTEARRLEMAVDEGALTQSLATYALNTRDLRAARDLYERYARSGQHRSRPDLEAGAYHQLGIIAQEERDISAARSWYEKSLAVRERKDGNELKASKTYHQLGTIAQENRDFPAARSWYEKSLAISEKSGNEQDAAITYHQLGLISQQDGDFVTARAWYEKSLATCVKSGNERGAAQTYHQLGTVAQDEGDYTAARLWYQKSLAVWEKQGDHLAANAYHHMGMIAQMELDFDTARSWYEKSLAIEEKHGNDHGAACTYGQLGNIAGMQRDFVQAGTWLIRCILTFAKVNDKVASQQGVSNFNVFYRCASEPERTTLRSMWKEAGLADLPWDQLIAKTFQP